MMWDSTRLAGRMHLVRIGRARRHGLLVPLAVTVTVSLVAPAGAEAGNTVPPPTYPVFKRVLKIDSVRYTGAGTTTLFATKSIAATIAVKADDLHDTLLVYATDRRCARTYSAAIAQTMAIEQSAGGVSELADVDLGYSAGAGVTVRNTGRFSYRYTVTNPQAAPGMRTLCVMLFDSPGDPRGSGNRYNIPADHVWQTTKAKIG